MHLRKALLQTANQRQVIFERQVGMQAAYDVEFGGALRDAFSGALVNFVESEVVRAG